MRLVWVNHYAVTPDLPGGTRHVELGRELARLGWEVSVVSTDFHFQERRFRRRSDAADRRLIEERVAGVRMLWLWSAPYRDNDWRRLWNWVSFARGVLRLRTPADVVIGSSPHLLAAAAAARKARRDGARFILEVRDLWPESIRAAGGRKGPVYHALGAIASWLYRRAERIVVLTRGVGDRLIERGVDPEKIVFAPNGVDVEAFEHVVGEPRPVVTFGYAGAHGPANGLDCLLDAAELLRDDPSIRIVCVGDGPLKPVLAARVREAGLSNVSFEPPVSKAEVPGVMARFDVGLMLLREAELFRFGVSPNKLFDYLAAGLPVVSNVGGDVASMIAAAGAGETVAGGSPSALAEAIRRMAARARAERLALGAAGRAWVAANHGRRNVAEHLDVAFRRLVGATA
ncbi:MAG: glycosyltransferase family 4 protein [Gemmatimonadales bacterium]